MTDDCRAAGRGCGATESNSSVADTSGRHSVPVDDAEFLADMKKMSAIGATAGGGVHRLAASKEDGEVRDWLARWLREHDFTVSVDAVGNLYGVHEWRPGAPYVVCGSHLDSQPLGGQLDGAYGVLAAAHAADRLRRQVVASGETPMYNLAVADWTNEEGARFQPSLLGSSVYAKQMTADEALALVDGDGISLREALAGIGYLGSQDAPWPPAAYAEVHIEQGHGLEEAGTPIGLVSTNWAAYKYEIEVIGEQSHTGPTPMDERKDALLGAAHLIVAARTLADELAPKILHTSVARVLTHPNSPNTVTSHATLFLELRSPDLDVLAAAEKLLFEAADEVQRSVGVRVIYRQATKRDVLHLDRGGVELARLSAEAIGLASMEVGTVAGQDAIAVAGVTQSVLVFVPSTIGHNEREHASDADLVNGVDTLTEIVTRMCHGELIDSEEDGSAM